MSDPVAAPAGSAVALLITTDVLCIVFSFLTSRGPRDDATIAPTQHRLLLGTFSRVSRRWHAATRHRHAWRDSSLAVRVGDGPHQLHALLTPSQAHPRESLHHLIVDCTENVGRRSAVPRSASAAAEPSSSFTSLLASSSWPSLRSVRFVTSAKASCSINDNHIAHRLLHAMSRLDLSTATSAGGATLLFPLLRSVRFVSCSFVDAPIRPDNSTISQRDALSPVNSASHRSLACCGTSALRLLHQCTQVSQLAITHGYIAAVDAQHFIDLKHLHHLHLQETSIDMPPPLSSQLTRCLVQTHLAAALRSVNIGYPAPGTGFPAGPNTPCAFETDMLHCLTLLPHLCHLAFSGVGRFGRSLLLFCHGAIEPSSTSSADRLPTVRPYASQLRSLRISWVSQILSPYRPGVPGKNFGHYAEYEHTDALQLWASEACARTHPHLRRIELRPTKGDSGPDLTRAIARAIGAPLWQQLTHFTCSTPMRMTTQQLALHRELCSEITALHEPPSSSTSVSVEQRSAESESSAPLHIFLDRSVNPAAAPMRFADMLEEVEQDDAMDADVAV